MGVPSFYRWLVGKYPKVAVNAVEEVGSSVDTSKPNPNGIEFDNLYLDLNGIIHPCFHPDQQLFPPTTFDEVFTSIFDYIDRIFRIVRPRKLFYMAIDGVAPRAKMNQQRSRRFRTAKDAEIAETEEERLRREFETAGREVLPKQERAEVSDSNVITPGTVFMEKLARALDYYIRSRLNTDPGWKSIMVILSDASVPGEGEHKIMSFIRRQRYLPGYNPNTRHCLYGLDSDLIMLALSTHEIHFSILREDVTKNDPNENVLTSLEMTLSRKEHNMLKSRQWFKNIIAGNGGGTLPRKPYQFLNIWTLREYLELDMKIPDAPFEVDLERIIDDFVFICFFTGNDFLPHLPSIEIHEGGIDLLIYVYKKMFRVLGGYLIDTSKTKQKKAAYIKVKRVERFIEEVGSYEEKIFEKRYRLREKKLQGLYQAKLEDEMSGNDHFENLQGDNTCRHPNVRLQPSAIRHSGTVSQLLSDKCKISSPGISETECTESSDALQNTKELKQKLNDFLRSNADLFKKGVVGNDKVKLGIPRWRERYYKEKFSAGNPTEMEITRKKIVEKYMEGLCWVLRYYFVGVPSWNWYYPFYYGPFASDLKGLACPRTEFKIGKPFKPFDQLMAVLPPRSSNALPEAYRGLMNSSDSRIMKFYPTEFVVDTDGKRYAWQGICHLPFIEEGPLLEATKKLEAELDVDEMERNSFKQDKIFVRDSHDLGLKISSMFSLPTGLKIAIDERSCDINGFLSLSSDNSATCSFTSPVIEMDDIIEDHTISAFFQNPDFHDHIAPKLLENVTKPDKTITEADIVERKLWHEFMGSQPPQMPNPQRCGRKIEDASKPCSSSSAREISAGGGFGWSDTGRGKPAARTQVTYDGYHGSNYCSRGSTSSYHANNANNYNREFQAKRDARFQQPAYGSVANRSENWRQSSAPMAGYSGRGRTMPSNLSQRWVALRGQTEK